MYGMLPAYHTRRSYATLCEALCGKTRQTLQASAWPRLNAAGACDARARRRSHGLTPRPTRDPA